MEHVIEVPEKVSSKVYQPSVPADNGVNEMRYQVARLYTALNIEVSSYSPVPPSVGHWLKSLIEMMILGPSICQRRRTFTRKRKFDERIETISRTEWSNQSSGRSSSTSYSIWCSCLHVWLVGSLIQTYLVGILLGHYGTNHLFHHLRVRNGLINSCVVSRDDKFMGI